MYQLYSHEYALEVHCVLYTVFNTAAVRLRVQYEYTEQVCGPSFEVLVN